LLPDAVDRSSSPSATRSVDSQATFNVGGSVAFHEHDPFRVSEQRPTTPPLPAESNTSTALGASAAKKIRAVSSRKDDNNVALSHTKLSQLVSEANKGLPQHMQMKNLKRQTVPSAFNDASIVDDFPYDYFPSLTLPFHSNAMDKVATPEKFLYGLFVGMGLKQPLCPAGFPPGFFDVTKLDSIFLAGIAKYHAHRVRFHQSGNHNKPPCFFAAPVTTLCPEKQEKFIDVDAKRWDSLAFQWLLTFPWGMEYLLLNFGCILRNMCGDPPPPKKKQGGQGGGGVAFQGEQYLQRQR
jgi:hypothetical protein